MKLALPLCLCLGSLLYVACTPTGGVVTQPSSGSGTEQQLARPRNVIFLIGDGMGLSQISAGMFANDNYVAFERMPVVGLHKPASYDNLVTDSAAGATAFASGVKTYNGAIGVRPDTTSCVTLFEQLGPRKMATGLVATSTIVHATPAAFFGHAASRREYELLAAQLAESEVDFFIGGGAKFFNARESDERDLIAEMRAGGRYVSTYFEGALHETPPVVAQRYGFLTALEDPLPVLGGRDYLKAATEMAINYLTEVSATPAGYFLVVEGSQIDWGGHANDTEYLVSEMREFSEVVDAVLDYAESDGETLVVVTADHETGGFAINYGSRPDSLVGAFTSDYHTATMVPVFAYGPGADAFAGIYENTAIYDKFRAALRLGAPAIER